MILYSEEGWGFGFLLQRTGSVAPKAFLFSVPSVAIAVLICSVDGWQQEFEMFVESNRPQTWLAVSAVVSLLVSFRTDQALNRFWEGTSLVHQMRGEWFDATSSLFAFTRSAMASKPTEVQEFRQTLVRLASMLHGFAMIEMVGDTQTFESPMPLDIIDLRGLDHDTVAHLRFCNRHGYNKFEVILHMIHCLVTDGHERKVIAVAPPILSRVFQEFSRGMVNLHNAKKITDTPFPFPYAQLITTFLLLHSLVTPMIVAAYIQVSWWAALVSFIWVFGAYSANFIATELEMPFGGDPNDLPLGTFHREMNESLLMLGHETSDLLPRTSRQAKRGWEELEMLDVINLEDFVPDHASHYGAVRSSIEGEFSSAPSVTSQLSNGARSSMGFMARNFTISPTKSIPAAPLQTRGSVKRGASAASLGSGRRGSAIRRGSGANQLSAAPI